MVERKYETRKHVSIDRVLISEHRFCDFCKKEITDHYWEINTHHSDWGNDSCDSFEEFDACCPACLRKAFDTYIEDSDSKYNTRVLEVEHHRWPNVEGDITYDET